MLYLQYRNSSSKKLSPYSRHDSKNHKRHSRSKSKEKYIVSSHNYFIEKKANSKRQSNYYYYYLIKF